MKKKSSKAKPICPRCGRPIDYYSVEPRGSRKYVYAVHYIYVGKKRKTKKCYLGPADSYEYVSRTHADVGLVLHGAQDKHRTIEYLQALARALSRTGIEELPASELEHAAKLLYRIADTLKHVAEMKKHGHL